MAILILFEQFLDKVCLNFLPLSRECFTKYDALCTFSIMRPLGVRLIVIKKVRNYGKLVFIKNMFENGWWGIHPLGSAPAAAIAMSLTTTPTSQFGFSEANSVTAVLK